jgi:hypothetical protein
MIDNRNTYPQWIAVDLDGTLAHYDAARGLSRDHIGAPVPLMLERVLGWLREGKTVKIFTARAVMPGQEVLVRAWCVLHIGVELVMTNAKDPGMQELWDDRCVAIERNTGKVICRCEDSHIDIDANKVG